jgi:type I restriction-modification system DNA methylase subunit
VIELWQMHLKNEYKHMNTNHRKQLQEKLWAAAEQLRANGSLKLNEISEPILGLIFLKFADVRFKRVKKNIVEQQSATYSVRSRPVTPDHYKAQGVLFMKIYMTVLANLTLS